MKKQDKSIDLSTEIKSETTFGQRHPKLVTAMKITGKVVVVGLAVIGGTGVVTTVIDAISSKVCIEDHSDIE